MPPSLGRGESVEQSGNSSRPHSQGTYLSESHSTPSRFLLVDYNETSKVFAVTHAFISAYRCVATILEPEPEMRSMGWVALSRTVEILRRHENHSKVREVLDMDTLLGTLLWIMYREIIPLASSTDYLEDISTEDLRAIRPLLTECTILVASTGLPRNDRTAILLSTPKWVLYRCLYYALQTISRIDLSNLGLTTTPDLDQVEQIMKMFKPPRYGIQSMNLSNNNLTCISSFFMSAFPKLRDLNVTGNPIKTFPISIIKSPLSLIVWTDKTGKAVHTVIRDRLQSSNDLLPQPRQTLVKICFQVLHRHSHMTTDIFQFKLSPRIRGLIARAYSCELCGEGQGTSGEGWIREATVQYGYPAIQLSGRLCVPCRTFLATEKSLRRSDYLSLYSYM